MILFFITYQCIKFMCTMCTVHNFIKLCTMRQIFLCRLCTKILNMMHKFDEKIVHCTIFCTISDSAQICTKMAQIPAQNGTNSCTKIDQQILLIVHNSAQALKNFCADMHKNWSANFIHWVWDALIKSKLGDVT